MSGNWDDLAAWWSAEVENDPAYVDDVHPMLLELLPSELGIAFDLGCGEGQGMRLVSGRGTIFGCDLSHELLRRAATPGWVVRSRLPHLDWLAADMIDSAFSVYLVDLIPDHVMFFSEAARVTKRGGVLAIVLNHPVYTAPGSAPLLDEDGEVLWRWGSYFAEGSSTEPAGEAAVEFFHRPLDELLTAAAAAGWSLERIIERGLSVSTIQRFPSYLGQEHIPRLLGVRWRRL